MKGAQLYRETEKAKPPGDNQHKKQDRSQRATEAPKTLKELGISKTQSANWQKLADNPKAVEKYLRATMKVSMTSGVGTLV